MLLQGGKARLVSVQPYLMAAFNRSRGASRRRRVAACSPRPGAPASRASRAKGWASVHNGRETAVEELLERERSRASGERCLPLS